MTNTKLLLFDLDGTLADTLQTVIRIYNEQVCRELSCKPVNWEDRQHLQNESPRKLFKQYGIHWYKLPLVIWRTKQLLNRQIGSIHPFDGVKKLLAELKQQGYQMGIVTSNSLQNAHHFLKQHQLSDFFQFIQSNRSLFGKHKTLKKVIEKNSFPKNSVVYIGDEPRDIIAAKRTGIFSIAVSWGYLGKKVLEKQQPDFLVDNFVELKAAIEQLWIKKTIQ